ncbi:holo-ACP synthase [Glaciihabitans sp. GrIS 2.15]|jgi:holo-[acyl-carrier protein] synthase|uniref:holo-ACP synthase n=1 Tax=Glaciihabitans sp. GrIS 2.15 TaxID=3071710 RepID=UPI002DF8914A|nr:holo-[acyl-carrier protein] synthase [Glaciihabitans sp. GrIS 2.15]
MIIGIGVDVVDLARFERATSRTPGVLTRLFADSEQWDGDARRSLSSLAARFAAKEAVIKAIGDSTGVRWHDMAVVSDGLRNPSIEVYNALADIVAARGITSIHLSVSHDAGIAIAYVIAEGHGVSNTGEVE